MKLWLYHLIGKDFHDGRQNAVSEVMYLCHCSEWCPSPVWKVKEYRKGKVCSQDWAEAILEVVTSNWELQPLTTAQVTDNSIQLSFPHFSTAHKTFWLALSWVVVQINSLQHSGRGRGMEGHSAGSYPNHREVPVHITMGIFFWQVVDNKEILIISWKNELEKSH